MNDKKELEKNITKLDSELEYVKGLRKDLEHHIEEYQSNGKELVGLKIEVANLVRESLLTRKTIENMGINFVTRNEFISLSSRFGKLIAWLLTIAATLIGSAIITIFVAVFVTDRAQANLQKEFTSILRKELPNFLESSLEVVE